MVTVIFNIIFVSTLCFGLVNNARKAGRTEQQQETKMTKYQKVRTIVDKKTGKSYTFTITKGGDHYEHNGPRGNFSLQKEYFGYAPFTEKSLIEIAKQYE